MAAMKRMTIADKLNDFRWAMNAMRARAWRRQLLFSQRLAFDDELRPMLKHGERIAYPDAIYHIKVNDLLRAMARSAKAARR